MKVVADTHVHLYPCYDVGRALSVLAANLRRAAPAGDAVCLGFLAERHDCAVHAALRDGRRVPADGFEVAPAPDGRAVIVRTGDDRARDDVYLLPGRQVVARERVEILALATEASVPDGLPAAEAVARVLDAGAVPVLAWAPGKWFLERGKVVRALIDRFAERGLLIGDSTLRPGVWPEPRLMRLARARGCRVLAGSDPLPFPGEEAMPGTYASLLEGSFNPADALASAASLLREGRVVQQAGRRGTLGQVVRRLWKNARA